MFLDTRGQILRNSWFIGPGHAEIYRYSNGNYYFTHHFYDGEHNGEPSLTIWKLYWKNHWPGIDIVSEVDL